MSAFDRAWGVVKSTIEGREHDDDGNALPWYEKTPTWSLLTDDDVEAEFGWPMCDQSECEDIAIWVGLFGSEQGYYCADHGPDLSEQESGVSAGSHIDTCPECKAYGGFSPSCSTWTENAKQGILNQDMPRDME